LSNQLAGNPVAVDWGKYCIGIDTNAATAIPAPRQWLGPGYQHDANGMDFWIGTWWMVSWAQYYWYDGFAGTTSVAPM